MINLEWIRTFRTVFEKGSMTAAAESLFISQPGVSLHLSSLESHIGYRLFDRFPRKLVPTERAKLLYNSIVDPIRQLEETERKFQKNSEEDRPTLTVGMCFETFQESLEKHLAELTVDLISEFGSYRALLEKLEKGLIDLVVTPHRIERRDVVYRPFSKENIILVAGKGTSLEGFRDAADTNDAGVLQAWLKRQKWYGITGDNEHLTRFWLLNFKGHPDFRPNYIVPNIHSIIRSLSVSPGLAVIPDFLCRTQLEEGSLTRLWDGFSPLSNTFYFARHKKEYYPGAIDELEGYIEGEMPRE